MSEELTKAGYSLIIAKIVNREVNPPQGLDAVGLLNWCSAYAQCQKDILDIIKKLRDSNGR